MPTQFWDPENLFTLTNPETGTQTCVGWAPSKGRRCQNPVAYQTRGGATAILNELALSYTTPLWSFMKDDLRKAASMCLCRRYHQGQTEEVVARWCRLLQRERENVPYRTRTPRQAPVQAHDRSRPRSTRSRAASPSPEPTRRQPSVQVNSRPVPRSTRSRAVSPSPEPTRRQASVQLNSRPLPRSLRFRAALPSPEPTSGSSPRLDHTPTTSRPLAAAPPRAYTPSEVVAQQRLAVHSLVSQPPSAPNRSPCTRTHVVRRSSDEDCAICTESLANAPLGELLWCKGTCGRNIHAACMGQWLRTGTNCVVCRGRWQPLCEHDSTYPVFSIWTEEDIGLVNLFNLMKHIMEKVNTWL